jgi:hypothetical protein
LELRHQLLGLEARLGRLFLLNLLLELDLTRLLLVDVLRQLDQQLPLRLGELIHRYLRVQGAVEVRARQN